MGVRAAPELMIAATPELMIARKIVNFRNIYFCTIGPHVRDDGAKPPANRSELRRVFFVFIEIRSNHR